MTHKRTLECIKIAGLEGDQKAFLRLYTENKVSYATAITEYRLGVALARRSQQMQAVASKVDA